MPTTGDSKDNAACIDRLFGNSLCDGVDRDLFLQSLYEIETDVSGDLKLEKFKRWWCYMSLFQVLICVLILVLCFRSASVEILFAYYVCAVMALVCEVLYLARLNGVINTLQRRH